MEYRDALSTGAATISVLALIVSGLAFRQARATALLTSRREAINHVREAFGDVVLHGNVTSKTTSAVREAFQLSSLVFSKTVIAGLDRLHGIAFRLEHKPTERWTDPDWNDKETLGSELQDLLKRMQSEAAVKWW
jgi:hypothetical protein